MRSFGARHLEEVEKMRSCKKGTSIPMHGFQKKRGRMPLLSPYLVRQREEGLRGDIQHSIGKTRFQPGMAVVHFIRIDGDKSSREAPVFFSATYEVLKSGQSLPDGKRIVGVRRVRKGHEERFKQRNFRELLYFRISTRFLLFFFHRQYPYSGSRTLRHTFTSFSAERLSKKRLSVNRFSHLLWFLLRKERILRLLHTQQRYEKSPRRGLYL